MPGYSVIDHSFGANLKLYKKSFLAAMSFWDWWTLKSALNDVPVLLSTGHVQQLSMTHFFSTDSLPSGF